MKEALLGAVLFISLGAHCIAQHATAQNGYYPSGYNGDTWTGVLTAVDDDSREMNLSCTDNKHGKTETFVGILEEGYITKTKGGHEVELKPSMIPLGTHLTVFYNIQTKKDKGEKVKVNTIFLIKGIPNLKRAQSFFKAF
jgi:3D (Asp-Asp-Asp) domain-containing protein